MGQHRVGDLVDSLGVTLEYDEDDMIPDVVVLAKIVAADGGVSVGIGSSETLSWIDQIGVLTAASDIVRQGYQRREDDD